MEHFDAIIIGFGKGGKLLAADLANRGQQVAIIERSAAMYGGSCINIACIPTKALIHQAQMIKELNLASFEEKAAAYRKAIIKKNEITTALRKLNFDRLNDHPNITVYTGVASFRSSRKIEVTTETDRLEIEGKRIFIDTGALPVIPPISGIRESRRVYTSTSLLELDLLPETLVIIGGGYIGLEFTSMFAVFGSKVIVLENTTEFLSREDRTIAEAVRKVMENQGIEFHFSIEMQSIQDTDEETVVTYRDTTDKTEHSLFANAVLVATGRQPNTESLDPGVAGIHLNEHGAIIVNEYLQTTASDIWALGDVSGGKQFTYISQDDYRIIRDQLFGKGSRTIVDREPVVYTVFIDPPLSRIGLTEQEAIAKGYEVMTKTIPVEAIPRARVSGNTNGVLKSVVNAKNGKILGCTLFCIDSGEVINNVALVMKAGLDYSSLRDQIYTHPSMSEALNDLFSF